MLTYSIAIRTLGTGGNNYRCELESIKNQTVQPEKVIIYIARGYDAPDYRIGKEEYVWIEKGMMAQRAVSYDEITSDCILTLDDDVELSPTFAEEMLQSMEENNMDMLGCDVFKVHEMSLRDKAYAALTNLVFPSWHGKYAFRIKANGSFNYLLHPRLSIYPTQSCAGPAILWKKSVLLKLDIPTELWLDALTFPYGEDALITYKAYVNGYNTGVCFSAKIKNLDTRTSSDPYRKGEERFYIRSKAMLSTWWRMLYKPHGIKIPGNKRVLVYGSLKLTWVTLVILFASMLRCNISAFKSHMKGIKDGYKLVNSPYFQNLPPYII